MSSHIISYAQNGEDVVLHRALSHIESGFYIDVGAYDPTFDSVTKLFYDRGWSGINIEPSLILHERLMQQRPRDQNLNVALAEREGELVFYQVEETGLSTLDLAVAKQAQMSGFRVEAIRTQVSTLSKVLWGIERRDIHFLKIDVEGAERLVLLGADFTNSRPWIVVIESTNPGTSDRVDDQWRELLEVAGYELVLFDGLNLFFLAREHQELRTSLAAPANVTDQFVPIQYHAAMLKVGAIQADVENQTLVPSAAPSKQAHDLIAWHSAFAQERLESTFAEKISWHRADAEGAVRRSMEETIAWHRADAAQRALWSEQALSAARLCEKEDALSVLRKEHYDLSAWRDRVRSSLWWRCAQPFRAIGRASNRLLQPKRKKTQ